jgi:hypothetical protein
VTEAIIPSLPRLDDLATAGTAITTFAGMDQVQGGFGGRMFWARQRAMVFRRDFATTGRPTSVATVDLVSVPYPTRFGLWRAALSPWEYLSLTNRMLIVRWTESDGRRRTLLFEPTDVDRGWHTPYFKAIAAATSPPLVRAMVTELGSVREHLRAAGIAPEEIDYLVFDHLHAQDVRRWIGTTKPAADISPDAPVAPYFPNARLVVQRAELAGLLEAQPSQRPWYQVETFHDLRPEGILAIDGDVLLGPGVALLATPGHVPGNQTLVLNTDTGIWAVSENAIATECFTPEHSLIPGVAGWAPAWQQELIMNVNTLETTGDQYNSMIIEKTIVDPVPSDPRFLQFFPSSELTSNPAWPGTRPTFTHGTITHG